MEQTPNFTTERAQRDYQLVCKAREQGDQSAFAALLKSYRQPIYLMLLKMTGDPTEADDLTIESFGKAFCALDHYTPTRPFSTWLYSIATNNCIDYIRKKRMNVISIDDLTVKDGDDEYEYQMPSDIGNPEEEMVRQQRREALRAIVSQMKPKYRRMIELRYFEELTYEEIAERLQLPINTVRTHLHRAHGLLHSILQERKDII
ncbi:MAG: sigma-70 family RNA polymerase sigma factor [Bacteroidales bacterium]|nr:sigma-70 family RNA polymerase sigma factor [Bacteroidales bacterium]